jgi:hypothetical protein
MRTIYNIHSRLRLLRTVLPVMLAASLLSSFPLWCGNTGFPRISLFSSFELIPEACAALTCLLILVLVLMPFSNFYRGLYLLPFFLTLALVVSDLNRLQYWVVIYNLLLFSVAGYSGRMDEEKSSSASFLILRIIVVVIYFLPGLSYLQHPELGRELSGLLLPLSSFFSERQMSAILKIQPYIPFALVITGAGLLIPPFRFLAFSLAFMTHVLLMCLLPFESFVNYPLLLLNFNFLILLILLFYDVAPLQLSVGSMFRKPAFWLIAVLLSVATFFSDWKEETSFHKAISWRSSGLTIEKEQYERLGLYEKSFCSRNSDEYFFAYGSWGRHALNCDSRSGEKEIREFMGRREREAAKVLRLASWKSERNSFPQPSALGVLPQ